MELESRCTGSGDEVRVFTRNQNDVTARMPEVVAVGRRLAVDDVILDGEAMALAHRWNSSTLSGDHEPIRHRGARHLRRYLCIRSSSTYFMSTGWI